MIARYTLAEMGAIWSEQARFEQILRVELAVARAQAARGLIPAAALEALESSKGAPGWTAISSLRLSRSYLRKGLKRGL